MSERRFITHQSMRSDLWESREGILIICFRISNVTALTSGRDNFENAPLVDADLSLHEDVFSKISGYVWTGSYVNDLPFVFHFPLLMTAFLFTFILQQPYPWQKSLALVLEVSLLL